MQNFHPLFVFLCCVKGFKAKQLNSECFSLPVIMRIGVRAGGAGGGRQPPQSRKISGKMLKIRAIKKRLIND